MATNSGNKHTDHTHTWYSTFRNIRNKEMHRLLYMYSIAHTYMYKYTDWPHVKSTVTRTQADHTFGVQLYKEF